MPVVRCRGHGISTNFVMAIIEIVSEFYWFLTHRHNREETRNYLKKVSSSQKKYL